MSENLYTYTPQVPEVFRCRVPLPGTTQAYVTNGVLREEVRFGDSFVLSPGHQKGFSLNVSQNGSSAETVQIISFRDSEDVSDLVFENSMYFGQDSVASVLLCTHTLTLDKFNTDEVVKVEVEKGANAIIVVMQNEHNSSNHKVKFDISVQEGAYLKINVITLHGALLENDFDVKLLGKGAVCELNGVYLVDGSQTINTNVQMNHLVADCLSSQLFKGILDDSAKATFSGRIVVRKMLRRPKPIRQTITC